MLGKADVVRRVLDASGRAQVVDSGGDIVVTDRDAVDVPSGAGAPGAWVVRLIDVGEQNAAYGGPFVVDRDHPLSRGVSLEGVAWGRGVEGGDAVDPQAHGATPWASEAQGAEVVIAAGDVPLVAVAEQSGGAPRVSVWWRPRVSTWQDTPAFVAWWWNLLEWRSDGLPGVARPNLRLGEAIELATRGLMQEVTLTTPDGGQRVLTASGGRVAVEAGAPGVYELRAGDGPVQRVAVNALAYGESDLTSAESGRWGTWIDDEARDREYRGVMWAIALAALAVLGMHGWLVARGGNV